MRLVGFDCGANRLTGSLPASYAAWRVVYGASFSDNYFTGTLPAAWGAMSSLYALILSSNKLQGTLPPEWVQMSRMNTLVLFNNTLEGRLPGLRIGLFPRVLTVMLPVDQALLYSPYWCAA